MVGYAKERRNFRQSYSGTSAYPGDAGRQWHADRSFTRTELPCRQTLRRRSAEHQAGINGQMFRFGRGMKVTYRCGSGPGRIWLHEGFPRGTNVPRRQAHTNLRRDQSNSTARNRKGNTERNRPPSLISASGPSGKIGGTFFVKKASPNPLQETLTLAGLVFSAQEK